MQFKRWFGWLSQFYLCIVTHGTEGRGDKILIHFPPRGVRDTAFNFLHRASLILRIRHSCGNCFVFLLDSHWMRYLTVLQWPFLNGSVEFLWVYLQKKPQLFMCNDRPLPFWSWSLCREASLPRAPVQQTSPRTSSIKPFRSLRI